MKQTTQLKTSTMEKKTIGNFRKRRLPFFIAQECGSYENSEVSRGRSLLCLGFFIFTQKKTVAK